MESDSDIEQVNGNEKLLMWHWKKRPESSGQFCLDIPFYFVYHPANHFSKAHIYLDKVVVRHRLHPQNASPSTIRLMYGSRYT